jgi:hypothetical protein
VRRRHLADLVQAERVELALDAVIQVVARAKAGFAGWVQTPRSAH